MPRDPKTVAAIPNYNMSKSLLALLPQLLSQGFDGIFILDDNSTDGTATKVKKQFEGVHLIEGKRNLGAAGNRNRVIKTLRDSGYDDGTIIVFIDADTQIVDKVSIPLVAKRLFKKYPGCGMIGGKVLNADGSWSAFNYGPLSPAKWMLTALLQLRIENTNKKSPIKASQLWRKHRKSLQDWPNPTEPPAPKKVGWLVETFTFIRLGTFAEVEGYNGSLRYCEAIDFARKLDTLGLVRIFEPSLRIKHLQIDNRGWRRIIEVSQALWKIWWANLMR